MDNRPFLDKISTSPHLPPQLGQRGYCSVKTFPDLSHTYIRTKFDKAPPKSATPDGRMTKAYTMKAKKKISKLHRGIAVLDAKEEVFKVDHKNYIDKLLLDMEATRMDQEQRRRRHWDSTKTGLGFSSEQFNFTGESTRSAITEGVDEGEANHENYSDEEFVDDNQEKNDIPQQHRTDTVRFDEKNIASTTSIDGDNESFTHTVSSVPSYMSGVKSGSRRCNRIEVFKDLLEKTEVKSPIKRYGSLER